MNIKKYLTLTRAGIIEALQFRLSMFVMVIGNILYLIVVYYLWKSIYDSAGTDIVNGMTFYDTMIYLVLATALFNFMEMYTVWDMGRAIQSGKIVLDLLKPMEYRKYLFWSFSGSFVTQFFFTFLPTFIVVSVVTKGAIHLGINLLYFVIAAVFAVSINYSIDFIVGTICLYTESIWGINIMKQMIVSLLSGAAIPLAFFPDWMTKVVNVLPFKVIYDTPLTLLLTADPDLKTVAVKLGTALAWTVAVSILSSLFWKISIKQVTVNGG